MNAKLKVFAILFVALTTLSFTTIAAYAQTLRLAHYAAESHPLHLAALEFKKSVESETNGKIKVEIYPNNTLGSSIQILENFQSGAVDFSLNTTGQLQMWVKEANAVQFPFIFENAGHAFKVLDGEGGEVIAKLAEPKGFKILSWWDWGMRQFTNSKRPINTPDDVKGLKFRVSPEVSMEASFQALGAVTEKIVFSELYMALAQKVVDGQDNPINATYHMKFYEHNKYITMVNYMYQPAIHMITTAQWAKLSDSEKSIIQKASYKSRDLMRKMMADEEASLIQKMKEAGCQFTTPDPVPFQTKMGQANVKIADFSGREFSKQFLSTVAKHATKEETKKYIQSVINGM
jgi:TRAP-type transport system periplasmic protein